MRTVSLSPFWRENKGIPPEEVKHITCTDILVQVWITCLTQYLLRPRVFQNYMKKNVLMIKKLVIYALIDYTLYRDIQQKIFYMIDTVTIFYRYLIFLLANYKTEKLVLDKTLLMCKIVWQNTYWYIVRIFIWHYSESSLTAGQLFFILGFRLNLFE